MIAAPVSSLPTRSIALPIIAALVLAGCSGAAVTPPDETGDAQSAVDDGTTDTGAIFSLTPAARDALEHKAKQGDGEAAFRLSEYWGMAGGDSGLAGDPKNRVEEERWLRVATGAGHEMAKFRLATLIAGRDCAAARKMLTEIADSTADPETRSSARTWLQGDYICESR